MTRAVECDLCRKFAFLNARSFRSNKNAILVINDLCLFKIVPLFLETSEILDVSFNLSTNAPIIGFPVRSKPGPATRGICGEIQ